MSKAKCISIDRVRGKKATAEIRDEVFKKFNQFLQTLVEDGSFTQAQVDNLGDHLVNVDEVGGDERGKSKSKVYVSTNASSEAWRTTDFVGDHEPFHVTLVLSTMATGIILRALQIIHSCPGVANPRMNSELLEHLPEHWSCRHTTSGSMTRELFEDWAKYFVRIMEEDGYGAKHGHPIVLLIDGHTSRWTYEGLSTLIDAGFYPFFIASHTSAWDQPNGEMSCFRFLKLLPCASHPKGTIF